MIPDGPQRSEDLIVGDYVAVLRGRAPVNGRGVDEGFARIERIERLAAINAADVFSYRLIPSSDPVTVAWCHGVPGPLVLRPGDVRVLDQTNPGRVEHDVSNPWWTGAPDRLLVGAHPAGAEHSRRRRSPSDRGRIDWACGSSPPRSPQCATAFTKPASALRVGDYLRAHTHRWPYQDADIDEGYARVEHLRLVEASAAGKVFADPAWLTTVVVATISGVPGVMLLVGSDEVAVMAFTNPERVADDCRNAWYEEPPFELVGSRCAKEEERRVADAVDAAARPAIDESCMYPSRYDNEIDRRMALESKSGFRSVPLAALPWPHLQSDCPLFEAVMAEAGSYPSSQAAHASAFISPEGEAAQASCPYHQVNWQELVRIFAEAGSAEAVASHPDYAGLSSEERRWRVMT